MAVEGWSFSCSLKRIAGGAPRQQQAWRPQLRGRPSALPALSAMHCCCHTTAPAGYGRLGPLLPPRLLPYAGGTCTDCVDASSLAWAATDLRPCLTKGCTGFAAAGPVQGAVLAARIHRRS